MVTIITVKLLIEALGFY